MRFILSIFCLLLMTVAIFAQEPAFTSQNKFSLYKPQYRFYLGSSYSYLPSFGGGMNIFAAPSVSLPLSKRLSAQGGIIVSTTSMPGFFPGEFNQNARNYSSLAIYGSTIYQLSPKLTLYGAGIKQLVNAPEIYPLTAFPKNSFTFGSSYRLGKGFSIGASIHVSEGYRLGLPGTHDYHNSFFSAFPW